MAAQAQIPDTLAQRWTLVRFETEAGIVQPAEDTDITAEFRDDRVAGSGGCNNYTAQVTVEGNALTIGPVAATRRACPSPISDREFEYFTALDAAQGYGLNDEGQLLVEYEIEAGSGTLVFNPQTVRALW
ncbi:MAG: META domain-containing protein [Cyanobacteria bacterium P01_A01_bin.135]